MTVRIARLALVLAAPLLLVGCLLAPGKFTSTLVVNADRTFTYTYQGEVYSFDMSQAMKDLPGKGDDEDGGKSSTSLTQAGWQKTPAKPDDDADTKAAADAHNRAIAEALSKEAGFRKVEYLGDGRFMIDYQISGKLDRTFVFPYNLDAGIIMPFIVIEPRANGTIRIKAPGFANDAKDMAGGGMPTDTSKMASKLDGTFTLDTDAELVSQNNEDGATTANGRSKVIWKATPLTGAAPMAVLRFK